MNEIETAHRLVTLGTLDIRADLLATGLLIGFLIFLAIGVYFSFFFRRDSNPVMPKNAEDKNELGPTTAVPITLLSSLSAISGVAVAVLLYVGYRLVGASDENVHWLGIASFVLAAVACIPVYLLIRYVRSALAKL